MHKLLLPKKVFGHVWTQEDPERKKGLTHDVHVLVVVMHVKQLFVQSVHTEDTSTYPEGQVSAHVWFGLSE